MRRRAAEHPDRIAFEFLNSAEGGVDSLSFSELLQEAAFVAAALARRGMDQKSRVLLLYPAGLEFIVAFLGCLSAGVVPVPAPLSLTPLGTAKILASAEDSAAGAVLANSAHLGRFRRLLAARLAVDDLQWIATDEISTEAPPDPSWLATPPDTAFIQYSSGSSGTPKGIVVSHGALANNLFLLNRALEVEPSDVSVSWLPHYHDMGLIAGILHAAYSGITALLMSPSTFLRRPGLWLSQISERGGTLSGGPNFAYEHCLAQVSDDEKRRLDLSRWSVAISGAEPVRAHTIERFARAFAPCGFRREAFYPCYGLAEATLIVSGGRRLGGPTILACDARALETNRAVAAAADTGGRSLAVVGCGTPQVDVLIIDPDTDAPLPERYVGEIWVGGGCVSDGYWRRPDETRRVFCAHPRAASEDCLVRTGDLGFLSGGELFVTGRLKDLIIIRGRNHHPEDIEVSVQHCHMALAGSVGAAFPIQTPEQEQLAVVFEVSGSVPPDELAGIGQVIREAIWARHEIEVHQIALVPAGQVPRTSSGKLRRGACKGAFLRGELRLLILWTSTQEAQGSFAP
jgi:acyl-CoA synthetase (AMP-forming)/AMP-acid ligase II